MIRKVLFVTLFIVLAFVSVFPRSTEVIAHNYVFGFDQGRDYLAAKHIVVDHKLTLIGSEWGAGSAGFTGLFHGPGYYYLISLSFLLFGGDPYGGVVFMLILGLSTIIIAFFVGKKLFGNFAGYLLALLVAISPPLIGQSRFFWNTYPSSPLILLVFYFAYQGIVTRRKLNFFLAAFFSAFIYNFQTAIAIPLCSSLFLFSLLFFRAKSFRYYIILFVGYFLGFLPLIVFEIRHHFQGILGLSKYLFYANTAQAVPSMLLRTIIDHFSTFVYVIFNAFPNTMLPEWILPLVIIIPLAYFLYKEEDKNIRFFLIYLLMIPIVAFLVFIPVHNSVYTYYIQELTFIVLILFVYITSRSVKYRSPFFLSIAIVFASWFFVIGLTNAFNVFTADVKDYGGDAKVKGKIDAIDYIYNDAGRKSFNLMIFVPPVYTYPYDYLLWWYGERKYGYMPSSNKRGSLYLLIETDHSKPWTYKGWLETVVKDGVVEKTITLPSGIIIQKRNIL